MLFGLIEKAVSVILVGLGILVLMLSGLVRWFGLTLAVIGAVMVLGNPIFGILAIIVGLLVYKFHDAAVWVVRLFGIGLIAWGILSFTGNIPLEVVRI